MGSKRMSVSDDQFSTIQRDMVANLSRAAELADVFALRAQSSHDLTRASSPALFAEQADAAEVRPSPSFSR